MNLDTVQMQTLFRNLVRANRLVLVDEDREQGGYISTIAAIVIEPGIVIIR